MSQRTPAVVALVAGVLIFLVALTGDSLGLGSSPGLGWMQLTGAVVGVAVAAFGMVRLRRA